MFRHMQDQSVIFLDYLVSRLDTMLTTPEERIIKQDEIGNSMYFICSGDCTINVVGNELNEHEAIRVLVEGDHFGEIALL